MGRASPDHSEADPGLVAQPPVDRRRYPRTAVVVPVDYSTVDAFFSEFTANINEGGMYVETEQLHPIDTTVSLHFKLPGSDEPFELKGRVAWCQSAAGGPDGSGMGIEFEELDEADRERLNELVRHLRQIG